MATLALKPVFPIRSRSPGSKRDHPRPHRTQDVLHAKPWRTLAITAGAVGLTFFAVLAPMLDDPAGRLFALDTLPTISTEWAMSGDAWSLQAFEFTPTTLGPAIPADMLTFAELAELDGSEVTMPDLEVRATPPAIDDELAPPG
jgi:hypothetical protein